MAPEIRLIATDLDGTLIGSANDFPLYKVFNEKINELRGKHNAVWAACTGRTFRSFSDFFYPMRTMGVMPDYVVTRHSYIYQLTRFGYMPHIFWDIHILFLVWLGKWHARDALEEWHRLITGGAHGVTTVRRKKDRLWLRFDTEESAKVAAEYLKQRTHPVYHLKIFRRLRELDIRPVPFTKGLAVSELARHVGTSPEKTLVIGNGHNDLSMLRSNVAELTGCPGNSEPEVMKAVHDAGGHVAGKRSLAGVMEILAAYMGGSVCSDLPAHWKEPPEGQQRRALRSRDKRSRKRGKSRLRNTMIVGVVYAIIVVFAAFDAIPFADLLLKPYRWLFTVLDRLLGFL